jgi:asparagine synthase (glutamine-hydrolysing)
VQPPEYRLASRDGGRHRSIVNRRLHHDVKWGNAKIILGYADKSAMHFSIEARVPYFDRQLVEFAFTLPAEFKVGAGSRKRILRDFARRFLPSEITERRDRMGFATPDAAWLRASLWPAVREGISGSTFRKSDCFEQRRLAKFVDEFQKGEHHDYRAMWRLWMLALWKAEFNITL